MDLYVTIKDENGEVLEDLNILQDGSDREGATQIANYIRDTFRVECEQ